MGGGRSSPLLRGALAVLLAAVGCAALALFGARQARGTELDQTLANFLGGGYKVRADDLDSQLEKYRVMRNVALANMGHHSLTHIPKMSPAERRDRLKALKSQALYRLHSIASSRGRNVDEYGLVEARQGASSLGTAGGGPSPGSGGDPACSAGDAALGLCTDDDGQPPLSDAQQALKDKESKVAEQLTAQEKASDAQRAKVEGEVNKVRLAKAQKLLHKLTSTDSLINQLVHHTMKIAGMAPHTPDP